MSIKRAVGLIAEFLTETAVLFIKLYKYIISPILPASCRFYPTCSSYSIEALRLHGPVKGLFLSIYRVLRCNPWGSGGVDPVPQRFKFFK